MPRSREARSAERSHPGRHWAAARGRRRHGRAEYAPQPANPLSATLPLTTKSPEARRLVQEALTLYLDRVEQEQSNEILRKAVQVDPDFAMGHEFLAQISLDSAEQVERTGKGICHQRPRNHLGATGDRVVSGCRRPQADFRHHQNERRAQPISARQVGGLDDDVVAFPAGPVRAGERHLRASPG